MDADEHELRRMLARVPTTVTIVTTYSDGEPVGFTASSFVNVSVKPPLVGVFVGESTRSRVHFERADRVAVNILSDEQSDVAATFAGRGDSKFAGVSLDPDFEHVPVLAHTVGAIVGRVVERPVHGDHLMLVLHAEEVVRRLHAPLVYHDRKFRSLTDLML